jgi:TetR/AcrR family transcriptional regulator, transcriptional repressor for nem operon
MGRTSDAKEKILAAAQDLIELRGYTAMGVADICKSAGVPKGSFYYFFDSKDALTLAVVDHEWELQRAAWAAALNSDEPPLDRLRRICEISAASLLAGQESCGVVSGCLFGNLALELGTNPTVAVRDRIQEIFEAQVEMIEAVAGSREAARSFIAQLEGQIMFAKLHNDMSRLDSLWINCRALLGADRP